MEPVIQQIYTDNFEHSFDDKGRITIPKEWRREGFEEVLHVIPSREGCLKVYPGSYLASKRKRLDEEGAGIDDPRRKALKSLASIIQQVSPDSNHRISIKEKFRQRAGLTKNANLVGRSDHFQIWDAARWADRGGDDLTLEEVAEQAGF
jgi:MraZ protein